MAYKGLILPIPLGDNGLTGAKSSALLGPGWLLKATNVSYAQGNLRKEGGATRYNDAPISGEPTIVGGWDWWPTTAIQRMIVATANGKLYKDSGAGNFSIVLKSGLTTADTRYVFVEAGQEAAALDRQLFIFNGKNVVQVLRADEDTTHDLTTPPADWAGTSQPSVGLLHEGSLWGAGNANDPHRWYFSTAANHEDFTGIGSGSISVYPGEGERIVAGLSYKGLLVTWKYPSGIYVVDTSQVLIANWRATRLNRILGGASPLGHMMVDDDVIFIDPSGQLHALSGITEFGNLGSRTLSQVALLEPFIREQVNISKITRASCIYYVNQREGFITLPARGSSVNNRRLGLDFNRVGQLRFRWSDFPVQESLWLRKDLNGIPRPVAGDDRGVVWLLDQADTTFGTEFGPGTTLGTWVLGTTPLPLELGPGGYASVAQTAYTDFGHVDPGLAMRRKNAQFLELDLEATGEWDLAVDLLWDERRSETVAFSQRGKGGTVLGSWVLGRDALGSEQLVTRRRRVTGGGRRLSLQFRQSSGGHTFSVLGARLYAQLGDQRL